VHYHDLSLAIAVRMRIFLRRTAMRGPAGVPDSISTFDGRLLNDFFEVAELPRRAPNLELAGFGDDSDPRGIIATVLQLAQTFDDDRDNLLRPDVADNSTQERRLLKALERA
jgi:hypothetical protein